MTTIDVLLKDLGELVMHILKPSNLALLATLGGMLRYTFTRITKVLDRRQDEMIKKIDDRVSELERNSQVEHAEMKIEILRVQILTGIDSKRLSRSEVAYFFDKYKKLGGNSFVEERVHWYLEQLDKEEKWH